MSEDKETHVEQTEIEVGAEVTRDDTEKDAEPSKVSAEKLRKAQLLDELNQEVSVKELPKREKPRAQISDKAELGKKLSVKLNKRYDVVQLQVYQGEKEEETGGGNNNCIHDKTDKRTDEVSYEFFDPVPLKGKTLNGLTKGKYLVRVHAYGQEAGDELEQEQVVDVQ